MSASLIAPEKIRAYLATDYRLGHTDQDIVLRIGERSDRLAALFNAHGVACGAFLTAYNPRGTQQPDEANERAHAELAAQISALQLIAIEGSGSEEGSEWPSERSYFALGMDLATAKRIGQLFDQDAIVWVGADAVAQLVLLR